MIDMVVGSVSVSLNPLAPSSRGPGFGSSFLFHFMEDYTLIDSVKSLLCLCCGHRIYYFSPKQEYNVLDIPI